MAEDPTQLINELIAARHHPEHARELLEAHMNEHSPFQYIKDVTVATCGLVRVLHMLSDMNHVVDGVLDTTVAASKDGHVTNSLTMNTPQELRSKTFAAALHAEFTEGTDPLDRRWSMERLENGEPTLNLSGTGFTTRVFVASGATAEDMETVYANVLAVEALSKPEPPDLTNI